MRCENCGMLFVGADKHCPQCGFSKAQCREQGLLKRKIIIGDHYEFNFIQIYVFAAINLSIVALSVNLALGTNSLWSILVVAALSLTAVLLYAVSNYRGLLKYYRRAVSILCSSLVLMQHFLFKGRWALDYAVPCILIVCSFITVALFFCGKFKLGSIVTTVCAISLHSVTPLVYYFLGYAGNSLASRALILVAFICNMILLLNVVLYAIYLIKHRLIKSLK